MSDFQTTLIVDSTIHDVTPDLEYGVKSGASSTTYQSFPASSPSNSSVTFSVQVPSENIIVGRDVLLTTGLSFTVNVGAGVASGSSAFNYGLTDALQAFPFASILSTAQATINNTTVSISLQDVLPSLLCMTDQTDLMHYNGMTPNYPDRNFAYYADQAGVATNSNVLGSILNASYDTAQLPRGCHPCAIQIDRYVSGTYTDHSPISTSSTTNTWKISVQTVVTEPIFLSPFIFGKPSHNCQGLLGVNNMSLSFNIDSTLKRLWSATPKGTSTITVTPGVTPNGISSNPNLFTNTVQVGLVTQPTTPTLLLKFLSSQPSQKLASKNVVPYMDYPRFITGSANTSSITAGASSTVTSSNVQLNQIPDLIIINVRKPMANQDATDTSGFLKINKISINLNNQSGLLSSATAYDLWRMSVRNGSQQSWIEFSGMANANITAGTGSIYSMIGSLLVIDPVYDLSLPDYLSSGSAGQYNLQFTVDVANQYSESFAPEMVTICCNSGIMVTNQGTTSTYTGLLTKDMVLKAKLEGKALSSELNSRLIGGKMLNRGLRKSLKEFVSSKVGGVMSGAGGSRMASFC
jgi:hypothetical protein